MERGGRYPWSYLRTLSHPHGQTNKLKILPSHTPRMRMVNIPKILSNVNKTKDLYIASRLFCLIELTNERLFPLSHLAYHYISVHQFKCPNL